MRIAGRLGRARGSGCAIRRPAESLTTFAEAPGAASDGAWAQGMILNCFERELQIVDQIAHAFDADAQSHERISDAELFPHFLRDRTMRHDCGVVNQAFDSAQAFRERK